MLLYDDWKVSTWITNQNVDRTEEENMSFSKVLILTLFIFGTFAIENMEERIEVIERKLDALTKADTETNRLTGQQMMTSIVSCFLFFLISSFFKKII